MEPEKKSNGALVGLVVIIIILIAGGVYIWRSNQEAEQEKQERLEELSSQDFGELDTLEAELLETDTATGVDVEAIN